MPELPDLVHLERVLGSALRGGTILRATVEEPIVLRILVPGDFSALIAGSTLGGLERHGPFLRLEVGDYDLVMHLMLAGRLRLGPSGAKPLAWQAFSLVLDSGETLSYGDEKSMGKIYLCPRGRHGAIPGYDSQGIDLTSPDFTREAFEGLIARKRCQVRVFLMDQSLLSAIGNAYADEILFAAGLHPKTLCSSLLPADRDRLFEAIRSVLAWGIAEVEAAGKPLEEKVRGHLRVRNRGGQPCPACGTTIRKAGVLGFDSFFCPRCQPDRSGRGLDWNKLPPAPRREGR